MNYYLKTNLIHFTNDAHVHINSLIFNVIKVDRSVYDMISSIKDLSSFECILWDHIPDVSFDTSFNIICKTEEIPNADPMEFNHELNEVTFNYRNLKGTMSAIKTDDTIKEFGHNVYAYDDCLSVNMKTIY